MSDMGPTSGNANHVINLCVCLHSRLTHHSVLGDSDYTADGPVTSRRPRGSDVVTDRCLARMPDGTNCKCQRFNVVSSKSSHAYRRGLKVERRKLVDLYPGDRVLTGWTPWSGRIRLLDHKTGAMISTISKMERALPDDDPRAAGQDWRQRTWLVTTDLGQSFPQAGGDVVLVVSG